MLMDLIDSDAVLSMLFMFFIQKNVFDPLQMICIVLMVCLFFFFNVFFFYELFRFRLRQLSSSAHLFLLVFLSRFDFCMFHKEKKSIQGVLFALAPRRLHEPL